MELQKAKITLDGGKEIEVLFNPASYSLDKGNQIAEIAVPGLESPILQYVRGNTRTLTMELFFDTYEKGKDVRDHTRQIYGLLGIEGETRVPPVCTFRWGKFEFPCVVERVSGRFTLFLPDGTAVRSTLNVSFKEYVDLELQVRETRTRSADVTKVRPVRRGDTLWDIAAAEYGDATQWRAIADANGIDNPRLLQPGRNLVIPALR